MAGEFPGASRRPDPSPVAPGGEPMAWGTGPAGGTPPPLPVPDVALPPPPPHPGFWWAVLWCIGFILATQVPSAILTVVVWLVLLIARGEDPPPMGNTAALMQSETFVLALAPGLLAAQLLGIAFSWMVIRLIVGRDWPRQLAVRLPGALHLLLALLALPGLILMANALDALGKRVLPSLMDLEGMTAVFNRWPWPFAVLAVGVGPGLAEELWCRGFLGRGLVGRYGVVWGVLLSSLFFGVIHLEPRQVLYATGVGVLLHFTYLTTRSLWAPVLLHFGNNTLSVLAPRVPDLEVLDRPP